MNDGPSSPRFLLDEALSNRRRREERLSPIFEMGRRGMADMTRVTFPMAMLIGILSAAIGVGSTYQFLTSTIQTHGTRLDQEDKELARIREEFGPRVRGVEDDNRDQKMQIAQLTSEFTAIATRIDQSGDDIRKKLDELQASVSRLSGTVEAIRDASSARLPTDRKQ